MTTSDDPLIASQGHLESSHEVLAPAEPPVPDEVIEARVAEAMGTTPLSPYSPRFPVSTIGITAILTVFGLALIFQSSRWANTPSYANLLIILSADVWGVVYLGVAALVAASLAWPVRQLRLLAHGAALVLLLGWDIAFFIRWLTDDGTTIVNVVSWGTYVTILLLSARWINVKMTAA